SGIEQSVPPPPYFASRSDRLRIESDGSMRASYARVSNGMTTLSGLRRRMAAANRAAASTHRIRLVAPRPRLPVIADFIEPDVSRPMTTGPGSFGTLPHAISAASCRAALILCGISSEAFRYAARYWYGNCRERRIWSDGATVSRCVDR